MFCNRKGTVHSSFSSANRLLQGIRSDEKLELEISALGGAIVLRDDTKKNGCVGVQARMRIAAPRVTFLGVAIFTRLGISLTQLSLRK